MCGGVGGCAGRVCVRLSTTTFFPQSSLLPWNHCECVGMCNIPTHSHSHPHPHTHTPTPTYLCVQVCGCGCGCALCVCLFMCVFEHDNLLPPLLAFAMGSLCVSVWVCGCVGVGVCIGGGVCGVFVCVYRGVCVLVRSYVPCLAFAIPKAAQSKILCNSQIPCSSFHVLWHDRAAMHIHKLTATYDQYKLLYM